MGPACFFRANGAFHLFHVVITGSRENLLNARLAPFVNEPDTRDLAGGLILISMARRMSRVLPRGPNGAT